MTRWIKGKYTTILLALLIAATVKVSLIFTQAIPFNSDEAVVALMARHILLGERPIFFYGQAYMGSLDAFLVAIGFWIFGEEVWVIRAVQGLLYLGVILTTYWIGIAGWGSRRIAGVAALLLAIPSVNVSLYTTASLGGYGEAMLLGNLLLLATLRIATRIRKRTDKIEKLTYFWFAWWGVSFGVGLWAFGLVLLYAFPSGLYLTWVMKKNINLHNRKHLIRGFLTLGPGFLFGSLPWCAYAVQNGINNLILELGGAAVAVEKGPFLSIVLRHTINYFLLGWTAVVGIRPPWEVRWLALPLAPFILMFWFGVFFLGLKRLITHRTLGPGEVLCVGLIAIQFIAFIFTPFGVDPSGRYFVPLAVPLALIAAHTLNSLPIKVQPYQWALVALVLVYHGIGTIQTATRNPPGITTQFNSETLVDHSYQDELIDFLSEVQIDRGYSNYWVSYPLAFSSQERMIFTPRLPYHTDQRYTERDDRYPPYSELVAQSEDLAYITTQYTHLDELMRTRLSNLGIRWKEKQIGDYRVYYQLSRKVLPSELGFGANQP